VSPEAQQLRDHVASATRVDVTSPAPLAKGPSFLSLGAARRGLGPRLPATSHAPRPSGISAFWVVDNRR